MTFSLTHIKPVQALLDWFKGKPMEPKDLGDIAAGSLVLGTLADWLPAVAAFLAIVWTLIRIYEWARVRIFKLDHKEQFK